MQRPGAAETHQREIARIDALRDGIAVDRQRHIVVDDTQHAECCVFDGKFQRPGDIFLDRGLRERGHDLEIAAKEMLGIEPTQHNLRVSDRGLFAALIVARWTGRSARRTRADSECPARIEVGNRAAAGADGVDINHRHQHRQVRDLGVARVLDAQFAVLDHGDVGRGAADVDRDDVFRVAAFARPAPTDDSARWSGKQQADGTTGGILHRRDPAVRLHDAYARLDAVLAQPTLQPLQIKRGCGPDIGIHRGRREALVFADHVDHFMRAADKRVGDDAFDDVARLRFVFVVEEREQETNDDRLQAALLERFRRRLDLIEREWDFNLAGRRSQTLVHDQPIAPFDERLRLPGHVELQREIVRTFVPSHMQDVAESTRGDHAHVGALTLDHHVGRHRRAVQHHVDRAWRHPGDAAHFHHALYDGYGLIGGRRGNFVHENPLLAPLQGLFENDVGEGSSDVHAHSDHACSSLRPPGEAGEQIAKFAASEIRFKSSASPRPCSSASFAQLRSRLAREPHCEIVRHLIHGDELHAGMRDHMLVKPLQHHQHMRTP